MTEVAVVEGDALELVCTFLGRPRPVVEWNGPRTTLLLPVENSVSLSSGYLVTSTLKVLNVSHLDEGQYFCVGDVLDYPAVSKTQSFSVFFQSEFLIGCHCVSVHVICRGLYFWWCQGRPSCHRNGLCCIIRI